MMLIHAPDLVMTEALLLSLEVHLAQGLERTQELLARLRDLAPDDPREAGNTLEELRARNAAEVQQAKARIADLLPRASAGYVRAQQCFEAAGKTEARAIRAARELGWVSPGRRALPRLEILYFFNRLTTERNEIGWLDWRSRDLMDSNDPEALFGGVEMLPGQPVPPARAVALLRGWYGIASDSACLRLLQRARADLRSVMQDQSDPLTKRLAHVLLPQARD